MSCPRLDRRGDDGRTWPTGVCDRVVCAYAHASSASRVTSCSPGKLDLMRVKFRDDGVDASEEKKSIIFFG